jgi:hypothetical protein
MILNMDAPDTDFAGYPAILKAGGRISGRISGYLKYPAIKSSIRPDTGS